jgi:hypothetical protein
VILLYTTIAPRGVGEQVFIYLKNMSISSSSAIVVSVKAFTLNFFSPFTKFIYSFWPDTKRGRL